jgi:hypothetical protein
MDAGEDWGALDELAIEGRQGERLRALAEYAELRRRWLRGEDQPGDHKRRIALWRLLDRTGGVPDALRWPKRREG